MLVKSDMLLLLLLFGGLLLAGCQVDLTETFNRKFKTTDLIGEYKADIAEWEEILILNANMTYSQKFKYKSNNMVKENKGTWELKDNRLDFKHMLFLRNFHEKDYNLETTNLGGCKIRKSGEKIIIFFGADLIAYQWESIPKK